MTIANRLLTIALGLFLISTGVAKFFGGHVFQYIEYQSGIDIFHPFVNNLTGVAEILAGGLILYRPTRLVGAAAASAILVGAIGFHLSPWLGIAMPTGLVDGASAPWDAADFTTSTSSATFVMAVVGGLRSVLVVQSELRRRSDKTTPVVATGDATTEAAMA